MLSINPFAVAGASLPAGFLQGFLVVMALAVLIGTLFDIIHKGSARYFFANMRTSKSEGPQAGRRRAGLDRRADRGSRRARLGRVLQRETPGRAPARHVRVRPLRRRHRGHGVLLSDARDAHAGDLAACCGGSAR